MSFIIAEIASIGWGLPNDKYRTLYNGDEGSTLFSIKKIPPFGIQSVSEQDEFIINYNPHFGRYVFLIPAAIGRFTGFISSSNDPEFYYKNFGELKNIYISFRLLNLLFSICIILLMYFIGKEIEDKKLGLILSFITSISPTILIHTGYGTHNILLVLLLVFQIYFLIRYSKSLQVKYLFFAGIFLGLSFSTKLSSILFIFLYLQFFIIDIKSNYKNLFNYIIFTFICIITLFSTSPYYIIFIISHLSSFGQYSTYDLELFKTMLLRTIGTYSWQIGPLVLITGITGMFLYFTKYKLKDLSFLVIFFAGFYLLSSFSVLSDDSRIIPSVIPLIVFSGFLLKKINKLTILILVLLPTLIISVYVKKYFISDETRKIASEKIISNANDIKNYSVGFPEEAYTYFSPEIIQHEIWLKDLKEIEKYGLKNQIDLLIYKENNYDTIINKPYQIVISNGHYHVTYNKYHTQATFKDSGYKLNSVFDNTRLIDWLNIPHRLDLYDTKTEIYSKDDYRQ